MSDLRETLRRAADRHEPPDGWLDRIERRVAARRRVRKMLAGAIGLAITSGLVVGLVTVVETRGPAPGDRGTTAARCESPVEPTGRWRADGSPEDALGNNDAILHGGVGFTDGVVGQAFALNGRDAYLEVPDSAALNVGSRDFTVSLWVNLFSTTGEQVLAEDWLEGADDSRGWTLTKLRDDTIGLAIDGAGAVVTPPLDLALDTWFQVAARRAGDTLSIFIDGEVVAVATLTDPWASGDSPATLKFGHRGTSNDTPGSSDKRPFFVRGALDEIELFVGRALSDAEINRSLEIRSRCAA